MNIEPAKSIALAAILDKLGYQPAKKRIKETVYLSPLREERTPSFHVHHEKNKWYDFGIGEGGDSLDFARAWLKSQGRTHSFADALRWLGDLGKLAPLKPPTRETDRTTADPKLILRKVSAIKEKALIRYLDSRGIPLLIARNYLKELRVCNSENGKTFFALGLQNEDEGYELRNKFFKGCIGTKAITFIRGQKEKQNALHVFEGMMDFLTAIVVNNNRPLNDDAIILNSLSLIEQAKPYIRNYTYKAAFTWMDNDHAGRKATKAWEAFFTTEADMTHTAMNPAYVEHRDVNAWHMHRLAQTPQVQP